MCRPIRPVIILVINKSDSRCAVVRFCCHSFDYRPIWTPLSPITITYYIDTDEISGFLLLLKNHIFIARSEDTIFIFHVWGYWCDHGYQHNYPFTIELLARARVQSTLNFIHKMASRCEDGRVIEFFSSLLEFWLFWYRKCKYYLFIYLFYLFIIYFISLL